MKIIIKIFNVVLLALLLTNCTTTLKYNNNSKTAKYSDKEIEASIKYPEDREKRCIQGNSANYGFPLRCDNFFGSNQKKAQ